NLSGADQDTGCIADLRLRQNSQKALVSEVCNGRRRVGMAQHALWSKNDQRLAPVAQRLAAQQVKILHCSRRLADLKIIAGRELQEPLRPGARMFRSLAFMAVG